MSTLTLQTARLRLVLESTEAVLARIEALRPAEQSEVSAEWLARLRGSPIASPWTHSFALVERATGTAVGSCGFKSAPDPDGAVEIAYGVDPDHRGRGFAKEAARALVEYALHAGGARVVRAHTRLENDASARVLGSCGFVMVGEVVDPEDGLVRRWELYPRAEGDAPR